MIDFKFWKNKKPKNIFSEFATKGLSESIKVGLTALATSVTNSTPVGIVVGTGAKGMMDALLAKSSQIENKIDKLIKEPLLSGIHFLHEGILYPDSNEKDIYSKDELLHDAHVNLIKAWKLTDSTEDSLFIRLLDSIAINAHSTHWQTTDTILDKLTSDINEQATKVEALEKDTEEQTRYTDAYSGFLDNSSDERNLRDKPMKHGLLKFYGNDLKSYTNKLKKRTAESRAKLDLLIDLHTLAKKLHSLNLAKKTG